MNGLERRLERVEATHRPRHPILLTVEQTPASDILATYQARAAVEGRRLVVIATGICRAPSDPLGAET